MKSSLLTKLDWQDLLSSLASHCQTDEARQRALHLRLDLTKEEILKSWDWTESICHLIDLGYSPEIGELSSVESLIRGTELGRVLDGGELRLVFDVLSTTERILLFLKDLASKARAFAEIKETITPCTSLFQTLDKSLDEEGELKDTASKELAKIRKGIKSLGGRIEGKLKEFFHGNEKETQYLQDQYFTKRLGRYVLPVRLDGRGRFSGTIVDTSVSAQTVFIEPSHIKSFNDELIELAQLEKIEQMRIFKQLSSFVKEESEKIRANYAALITIDYFTACAQFALKMRAGKAEISSFPCVDLIKAHHPLLYLNDPKGSISNDIVMDGSHRTLIISGPNAGGKSVVLKTTGLIHAMAKGGLLVPCDPKSRLFLFDNLHVELGDAQSLSHNYSSFSGHLNNLKPILEKAEEKDLILLDEVATGTEPQTGAAIAQAVLERLHDRGCFTIVTTHFDGLKQIASQDHSYRNGSMEYSPGGATATYKLILDVPGQSYGLELAEKVGLDSDLVNRAREIRGNRDSSVELLLTELSHKRDELREKEEILKKKNAKVNELSQRMDKELLSVKQKKGENIKNLVSYYDKKLEKMHEDFYVLESQFKKLIKAAKTKSPLSQNEEIRKLGELKDQTENQISLLNKSILSINSEREEKTEKLPGKAYSFDQAKAGDVVYVVSLKKEGSIVDIIDSGQKKLEVAIGPLRVSVEASSLRYLSSVGPKKDSKQKKMKSFFKEKRQDSKSLSLEFQTETNTLNLRGLRRDEALNSMWKFIDKALLRGEHCIYIVHGHGMDALKSAVRGALSDKSPYSLSYKSAEQNEGGDGVTIVSFES